MSEITQAGPGREVAIPNPLNRPIGLEDFDTRDQVMPIIRIDHHEGVFVDSLTEVTYEKLNVVLLGLIKGRTLWPANVQPEGSREQPLCRSYDFKSGHPVLVDGDGDPKPDRFPWGASGFGQTDQPLPCSTCKLKDWGTHPTRDAPWCSEVHTFGLVLPTGEEGGFMASLLQIQRSSLKASRTYCSSFSNRAEPLFVAWTELSLDKRKMGNNPYCVVKFKEIQQSDPQHHPFFAASYLGIREYLTTPRQEDVEDMPVEAETPAVVSQPEPAPAAAEPAPVSTAPSAPAPAAPAPAPAAPVAEAAPPPAAAPAPAPAAPAPAPEPAPAPPAPAPAPAAPPPPEPAAPAPAPAGGSTELPF